ncbi:hypothetical protein [Paludisphaera borealis]|uniref:Ribbon-helix-helix protein CopG domain-containing protein n=1 Tax=Paludisphaera borealis TaxID=1387353 RepID=A0A1U7CX37_9BACT|nr:hypothetical protein [Paludisphaera borealis]APW63507.1 hypothetical protein BSF38_05079 [Paludisphaera borealis]
MSKIENRVAHIQVDSRQNSRLLVTIPISQRADMAELSERLGMSQQAIVRAALADFAIKYAPEPALDKPAKKARVKKS